MVEAVGSSPILTIEDIGNLTRLREAPLKILLQARLVLVFLGVLLSDITLVEDF